MPSPLLLGIPGPEITPADAALYQRIQPAGYILFSRNIISPEQTRKLTDDLRSLSHDDPIIAIDQEGGRVSRTKEIAPVLPSAARLAKRADPNVIARAGALTADLLRLLGCNLNFAPVLDIDHHPDQQNSLRGRCWGTDSQRVIDHAGMWNRWMRKRSLRSCGKHFPSCGLATTDPHHDLPVSHATLADLLKEDILPYTALMPELDAVMTAHVLFPNIDPDHPASLSPKIIRSFLRDQLGFDHHLVITDDLDMGAITARYGRGPDAKAAIAAGNDLALICHRIETAETAAAAIATLPHSTLQDAYSRIERFRKRHATLIWSRKTWDATCQALSELAATFPPDEPDESSSPVAQY
jgi:beta-N-acetylhexosaminidase